MALLVFLSKFLGPAEEFFGLFDSLNLDFNVADLCVHILLVAMLRSIHREHLSRRLFGSMLRMIAGLPLPDG